MKRLRLLVRLFVLVAMMFSLAESVWASVCASMATMAVSDTAMSGDMPGMPAMPGPDEQQSDDNGPSCPHGPAAVAQGCLTAASLPANSAEPLAFTDRRAVYASVTAPAHGRIYNATPFHPPRA
jgi:hypothetical protein